MGTILRPKLHGVMKRAADHLVPFQVSIELTHRCNLRCTHCYVDTRSPREMTLKECTVVLDQLADAGTMYLMFTGGEVLVREDFMDIAWYARNRGFLLTILTNGTLLTPATAYELALLEPVQVGLSLHGACSQTHDAITGVPGSFDRLMEAIRLLKHHEVTVGLQGNVMDSNVHEIPDIKALGTKLGVNVHLSSEFVPGKSGSMEPFGHEAASQQLCKGMGQQWIEESQAAAKVGPCKAGKGICSVAPNGDVFPCLLMPMKIGNLLETGFQELWKTHPCKELEQLRSVTADDMTECKACAIAAFCHRCMGVAYSETGSVTSPAPTACRNAHLKYSYITQRKEV